MSEVSQTEVQKINFMSICDMAESNQNKIAIDKYHILIMGGLAGGAFLTQLRYWFSPTTKKDTKGQQRVGIKREGLTWLAKNDSDWWDECFVTIDQVKSIKKKLLQLGIVKIKHWKFAGNRTTHYHLDLQKYADLYHKYRVMNIEKERYEQEKRGINSDLPRGQWKNHRPVDVKSTDRSGEKPSTLYISLQHLLSPSQLEKHVANVLSNQNGIKMSSELRGQALAMYKKLDSNQKDSYSVLMSLPPSTDKDEGFNAIQALRIAQTYTFDEVCDGLRVIGEHMDDGTIPKKIGGYTTWVLERGLKPKSPNIKINKDFWGSIKNRYRDSDIKEHEECLELDDMTAFYFWMDHEQFKKELSDALRNL